MLGHYRDQGVGLTSSQNSYFMSEIQKIHNQPQLVPHISMRESEQKEERGAYRIGLWAVSVLRFRWEFSDHGMGRSRTNEKLWVGRTGRSQVTTVRLPSSPEAKLEADPWSTRVAGKREEKLL
jgi:hypothetical protein